jgi:hypothetical protein
LNDGPGFAYGEGGFIRTSGDAVEPAQAVQRAGGSNILASSVLVEERNRLFKLVLSFREQTFDLRDFS